MTIPKNKPTKGSAEVRSFVMPDLRVTADGGNIVEGHAAVFGQKANIGGWFYEVIERGAFERTDFTDVLYSACNHDAILSQRIPLARSRNNNANSTLQLKVDDQGLHTRAALDIERNVDARALFSAVERGDIRGMSLVMYVAEDRWEGLDTDMPTRFITAVSRVIEVTPASLPAYEGTDINARDQRALESAAGVLESARSRLESQKNEQRQKELEVLRLRTQILSKE